MVTSEWWRVGTGSRALLWVFCLMSGVWVGSTWSWRCLLAGSEAVSRCVYCVGATLSSVMRERWQLSSRGVLGGESCASCSPCRGLVVCVRIRCGNFLVASRAGVGGMGAKIPLHSGAAWATRLTDIESRGKECTKKSVKNLRCNRFFFRSGWRGGSLGL